MVESDRLESGYLGKPGSRVRIPLSPPTFAKASVGWRHFLTENKITSTSTLMTKVALRSLVFLRSYSRVSVVGLVLRLRDKSLK